MYRKDERYIDAVIGMVKSTNHRLMVVTILRRLDWPCTNLITKRPYKRPSEALETA